MLGRASAGLVVDDDLACPGARADGLAEGEVGLALEDDPPVADLGRQAGLGRRPHRGGERWPALDELGDQVGGGAAQLGQVGGVGGEQEVRGPVLGRGDPLDSRVDQVERQRCAGPVDRELEGLVRDRPAHHRRRWHEGPGTLVQVLGLAAVDPVEQALGDDDRPIVVERGGGLGKAVLEVAAEVDGQVGRELGPRFGVAGPERVEGRLLGGVEHGSTLRRPVRVPLPTRCHKVRRVLHT